MNEMALRINNYIIYGRCSMDEKERYQNIIVEFNECGNAIDVKNVDETEVIYDEEENRTILGAELRSCDEALEYEEEEEEEVYESGFKVEFNPDGLAIDVKGKVEYHPKEIWTIPGPEVPIAVLCSYDPNTGYGRWRCVDGKWRCIPE